jgi:hypothetical protein
MTPELFEQLQCAIQDGWTVHTSYDDGIVTAWADDGVVRTAMYTSPGDSVVPMLADILSDIANDRFLDDRPIEEEDEPPYYLDDDETLEPHDGVLDLTQ